MMETYIKYNDTNNSDTLICESKGLELIQSAIDEFSNRYIKTPKIIQVTNNELHMQKINIQNIKNSVLKSRCRVSNTA